MKKLTYVTVMVRGQGRRTNAHKVEGAVSFAGPVGGIWYVFRFIDEGITWARGWHTPAAKALAAATALL